MSSPNSNDASSVYRPGGIVALARDMLGTHMPDDRFVTAQRLGPGIVQCVNEEGWVSVLWVDAGAETWVQAADLRSLGEGAHLISVYSLGAFGWSRQLRRGIDTRAGLRHNWSVCMLHNHVVRTIRDDGWVWTFEHNTVLDRMNLIHTTGMYQVPLPGDDEAEALTVAEMARAGLDIRVTARSWQWVPVDY